MGGLQGATRGHDEELWAFSFLASLQSPTALLLKSGTPQPMFSPLPLRPTPHTASSRPLQAREATVLGPESWQQETDDK